MVDGDDLKTNPIAVMSQLQSALNLQPKLDYARHLRYVPKKGFFCQVLNDSSAAGRPGDADESNRNPSRPLDRVIRQTINTMDVLNRTDHVFGNGSANEFRNGFRNGLGNRLGNGFGNTSNNESSNGLTTSDSVHASDDSDGAQVKCLGKSKGRVYAKIDLRSINFLHKYYLKCNTMLFKLLVRLKVRIPAWLLDELS